MSCTKIKSRNLPPARTPENPSAFVSSSPGARPRQFGIFEQKLRVKTGFEGVSDTKAASFRGYNLLYLTQDK